MPHPDVALERARLRFAQECLETMRQRTTARVAEEHVLAANEADAEAVKWQLQRRLDSLNDEAGSLCFGRIDDHDGDRWYIGRRHVEDPKGAAVVVDWRAGVATPFYRATLADPLGLRLRRRFVFNGRELADVFEEDFDDPDSLAGSGGVPDPLLAELGRARTGQMRDIVATIQGEQDTIIRAPLETCLVVQGGPGTGKTAVGLHRAAFLMYEHRARLARGGVLVVGPNPVFLRYISQVLPSLGETSATQTTVDGLLGLRFRVVAEDADDVAAVKGDARMCTLIARAAAGAIRIPDAGIVLEHRRRQFPVSADALRTLVDAVRARAVPVATQRERFRRALVHHVYDVMTRGVPIGFDSEELGAELLADPASRKAIDGCWRSVGAVALVKSLLTQRAVLARAADGVLDEKEQALLLRPRAQADAWTAADLPLLDEAEALLKGGPRQHDHVVVDEAQDLSPMQLRMLARRARRHSMTVLGDLAEATGPASPGSWTETLAHLGEPANAQHAELTMGYRLPGAVLSLANRLLAARRAGHRAVAFGAPGRRPTRPAPCRAGRARRTGRRARGRARRRLGDRGGDRRAGAGRPTPCRARSARCRVGRAGGGRARPSDRRGTRAAREGSRVRRCHRRGTGGDRRRRRARGSAALRRAHPRGAAPRDRLHRDAPARAREPRRRAEARTSADRSRAMAGRSS